MLVVKRQPGLYCYPRGCPTVEPTADLLRDGAALASWNDSDGWLTEAGERVDGGRWESGKAGGDSDGPLGQRHAHGSPTLATLVH